MMIFRRSSGAARLGERAGGAREEERGSCSLDACATTASALPLEPRHRELGCIVGIGGRSRRLRGNARDGIGHHRTGQDANLGLWRNATLEPGLAAVARSVAPSPMPDASPSASRRSPG